MILSQSPHKDVQLTADQAQVKAALDPSRDKTGDSLLPFSVVIKNNSATDILGYVVRWQLVNANNKPISHTVVNFDYNTFQALSPGRSRLLSVLEVTCPP